MWTIRFLLMDPILEEIRKETKVILVDFHAETTSEKIAFGHAFDGKVSAVVGTHTHVQTADEKVLVGGTAYITDVGFCGAHDSVIGRGERVSSWIGFRTLMPVKMHLATGGDPVRWGGDRCG